MVARRDREVARKDPIGRPKSPEKVQGGESRAVGADHGEPGGPLSSSAAIVHDGGRGGLTGYALESCLYGYPPAGI